MQDLHTMCVDKSSCKADMNKHKTPVHTLTKDSFKKTYEQKENSCEEHPAKKE